ncbi:MAG: NAD-dependent epimerase/dehydratase family protein [Thermodesulfovibrionales bacterium]|nr:NAD-dependent epimerase/dehydratase family protein [Thermodesulfovibrionales bacterium]
MSLKGKKVLVTGGAGFIGSHTVDALVREGANVVVVDNLSSGRRENINPEAAFYEVNIADPEIEIIMEKERPGIICHFAYFVFVPKSVQNPLLDMDCLAGTLRILGKAKDLNVKKVLYSSSGFVYGNNPNLPLKEKEPFSYDTPYAISKEATENYLRFFSKTYGLPYVVLRYATVYGPGQATGAMADYIRKLSSGQQADIWGDGTKTRDYVFIADVVRANLLALTVRSDNPDPVFNISSGVETTLNTLYKKTSDLLGRKAMPVYHKDRPGEQIRFCLNNSKAKKELGWRPEFSLDEGLKITVEAAAKGNG